jgi:hypothetical protein
MKSQHPYKSNSHDERYFHVPLNNADVPGIKAPCSHKTVFARYEPSYFGGSWLVSVAYCNARDQFCRATGRKIARRKYFAHDRSPVLNVSLLNLAHGFTYLDAQQLVLAAGVNAKP